MKTPLTYKMAHAAAWDEGNRNMRKHGRKTWNRADFNTAARELERLRVAVGGFFADMERILYDIEKING